MEPMHVILFFQIVVESLPISSSGHVFLLETFFGEKSLWNEVLDHLSHLPTILILTIFFFKSWYPIARKLFFIMFKQDRKRDSEKKFMIIFIKFISYVLVADVVTAALYFSISKAGFWALWIGFIITSIFLFSLLLIPNSNKNGVLTFKKYLILGAVQGISLVPGISRFASTYVLGRWLSLSPNRAFRTSFLIQFPLITAGFFRALIKSVKMQEKFLFYSWETVLVVIVATVISYILFNLAYKLAITNKLWIFGIYTFVLGMILLLRGVI